MKKFFKHLLIRYNLRKFKIVRLAINYARAYQKRRTLSTHDFEEEIQNKEIYIINQPTQDGMKDYPSTRPRLTFEYLDGLVRWLATSEYKIMSYHDLAGIPEFGQEAAEFSRWIAKASKDSQKGILLQYDVDANPAVTSRLLDTHIALGIPANVMVFAHKIFDWKLKREGILEYDNDYKLDFKKFEQFQKIGGVIGYHCNAFDQAAGNESLALEIFEKDVKELRKHVDIRFVSMHGGHVTKEGKSNSTLEIHALLSKLGLTWVHNGHSIYFHRNWADGGASNPKYKKEPGDLLDFILSTKIGERTRLLFHPQYYHDYRERKFEFPILKESAWVKETQQFFQQKDMDGRRYWQIRYEAAQKNVTSFEKFFQKTEDEGPIFINGLSRSGTTLLVSMFDAHPDGAMAYESYPRYLHTSSNEQALTRENFIFAYQTLMNYSDIEAFNLLDEDPFRYLKTFSAVSNWTGMNTKEIGELLRAYLIKKDQIKNPQEALQVIAATARFKMNKEKAKFWGTKCQGNFSDYLELWPQARFVHILRHGLDILASQKKNGAFNPDPKQLGIKWRQNYENFKNFKARNPHVSCAFIKYEDLVQNPEATMRKLCDEIGLDYHPQMIRQHEIENTLIKNPRGQLSVQRIQQPIDITSVGRWQRELSDVEISAFLKGCGGIETFRQLGYCESLRRIYG